MSQTAVESPVVPDDDLPGDSLSRSRRPKSDNLLFAALTPLASLRLTVVLFMLSFFLVFAGTLAQIDSSIWTVVNQYFRSAYVWIPFQLFVQFAQIFFGVPTHVRVSGSFPYPGGWLLGGLLLANLLAAHLVRFKLSWKRSGILVLHSGLVLLMLSEVITGAFALEGNMTIDEGKSSNFVEHNRWAELALIDSSDPKADEVVVVPQRFLQKGGLIQHGQLPVDVEVVQYMVNSSDLIPVEEAEKDWKNPATTGAGLKYLVKGQPETAGTSQQQTVDVPAAYVTFKDKADGKVLGTYLLSIVLNPQPLKVGDKTYQVGLRFKRTYKPYAVKLLDFRFDRYEGTEIAKNYSSLVRLMDPERGEDREVLIRMNEPLSHRGDTFYQADFDKRTETTTHLQVVRDPGKLNTWLSLPLLGCAVVALGMLMHFRLTLVEFLRRRFAQ